VLPPEHRQQLARDLLERGELVVTVAGGSMAPTLPIGARVIVRPLPARAGDVGLFRVTASPGFLLHRVIARLPGGYVVHAGDRPGARAGVARARDLLGRADVPWQPLGAGIRAKALLGALLARLSR